MKKVGLCIVVLIIAIIGAILIPWQKLNIFKDKLIGVDNNYASLKVYSLGGDMKVFLDDEDKGVIKSQDPFLEIFPIESGKHNVRLKRVTSDESFYPDFEREVDFAKGFDTVIGCEIGPTKESSSNWLIYAQQTNNNNGAALVNITSDIENCNVIFNDSDTQTIPVQSKSIGLDQQYNIKVSKEGYQDLEFQILPEEQEARDRLDGYILYIEVNLYKIPI